MYTQADATFTALTHKHIQKHIHTHAHTKIHAGSKEILQSQKTIINPIEAMSILGVKSVRLDLTFFYKIFNNLISINICDHL